MTRTKIIFVFIPVFFVISVIFVIPVHAADIVVDGDPSDWTALGLTPLGTDPPYNIKSYHDTCADLLEAWVYYDSNNLYLMIKVRGGYPDDWDNNVYFIALDTDQNSHTGSQIGAEYVVMGSDGSGALYVWNKITLEFDFEKFIPIAAGDLGYVEWCVSLEDIQRPEKANLKFDTFDDIFDDTVNTIYLHDVAIPEFPSFLILPLFMIATSLAVTIYKKRNQVK